MSSAERSVAALGAKGAVRPWECDPIRLLEKGKFKNEFEGPELDFRLESRGSHLLGNQRQGDRAPQSDLVDRRRTHRIFRLVDLEHRGDQAAGGRFPLYHR